MGRVSKRASTYHAAQLLRKHQIRLRCFPRRCGSLHEDVKVLRRVNRAIQYDDGVYVANLVFLFAAKDTCKQTATDGRW